ncbi:hypothetical protein VP1G_09404 [Cytospora mali]|uniref:L-dopachrome isomerase n=1 Tax=Cytospora mali TaxID=578113 RepID=A0A194VE54_CYTMA|nr:hypothetical protein VP1G_09404 [Valsa mali var. pyri (nom. inval.)]
MSFAERKAAAGKYVWTLPQLTETEELIRPISRRPPGDNGRSEAMTMGRAELTRQKNNCYEDAFSVHGGGNPRRERILGDSMVIVELKTNVIIGDEFVFITELSAKLAEQYQRPLSSIAVHVQHSACIFFAGTFEPAYVVTVSALAPYVRPMTNRRNAYLLSDHLEEAPGVLSPRGLIRFTALTEKDVALCGKTMAQVLEEDADVSSSMTVIDEERPVSSARRKRLSVKSFSNIKASPLAGEITPPTSVDDSPLVGEKPEPIKVARRRKSFVAGLFGRPESRKENKKQIPETS